MSETPQTDTEQSEMAERWTQRWEDALRPGEKPPHLQESAVKITRFGDDIALTYTPFLVPQGLNISRFFTKDMRARLTTTLRATPFLAVTGITGPLAGNLGAGVRHGQGFAVIHSDKPVPANPATYAPAPHGTERNDAVKWVIAGRLNEAFENAKLDHPEVDSVIPLTMPDSAGHIWRAKVRLYGHGSLEDVKNARTTISRAFDGAFIGIQPIAGTGLIFLTIGADPNDDAVRVRDERVRTELINAAGAPVAEKPKPVADERRIALTEKTRTYNFGERGSVTYRNVTELVIRSSGTHRLKADGKLIVVSPGWLAIEIDDGGNDWTV